MSENILLLDLGSTLTSITNDVVPCHNAHHFMTLEAMDDLDAGRVVDHQSVRVWAESLNEDHPPSLRSNP